MAKVEYALESKKGDNIIFFKLKDTDRYLLFGSVQTFKLKHENNYSKIIDAEDVNFLIKVHNETIGSMTVLKRDYNLVERAMLEYEEEE